MYAELEVGKWPYKKFPSWCFGFPSGFQRITATEVCNRLDQPARVTTSTLSWGSSDDREGLILFVEEDKKKKFFLTCRSSAHNDEIVDGVRNGATLRAAAGVLQIALWPDEHFKQPHEEHEGWTPARAGQSGPRLRHRTVTAHPAETRTLDVGKAQDTTS